jgi:hypothetical protein
MNFITGSSLRWCLGSEVAEEATLMEDANVRNGSSADPGLNVWNGWKADLQPAS